MKANDYIIVIGRQFGSGGRKLGKILADRLGIPYYDKELLEEAATQMGFRKELFAGVDERKPSFVRSIINMAYGITASDFSIEGLTDEQIYIQQSEAIRAVIDNGPCIIVGRTADYVARQKPNLFSIFLCADLETRAKRIMERGDCPTIEAAKEFAVKKDKLRESYYNYYTGRKWGAASNYDLCVNSSHTDIEDIAEMIIYMLDHLKNRFTQTQTEILK